MEKDRNDQAVMMVSGDFLIGVRGAAAGASQVRPLENLAAPRRSSSYTN
jgi:hypothetical protein